MVINTKETEFTKESTEIFLKVTDSKNNKSNLEELVENKHQLDTKQKELLLVFIG